MRVRIALLVLSVSVLTPAPEAHAASRSAVVSQVYGSGGNAGATYNRDFIELFNRSKSTLDLSKWHVQYSPSSSDRWSSTALVGTVSPYRYYLVTLDGSSSGGASLPAADATGTTNMNGSSGRVRLLDGADALVDAVAYGTGATGGEGKAAPGASDGKQSVTRKRAGCVDTDANSSDFEAVPVKPHNKSSAANRCDSPPALNVIGNRAVHTGSQLSFTLSAFDPDGDHLTYSASGLPSGATFHADSRTFAWRPASSNVGSYPGVRFAVSDGFSTDPETITIGVAPASASGPSRATLRVVRTESELSGGGSVSPDHRYFPVVVRLFRRANGKWIYISDQRPTLDANSAYRVSFPRPKGRRCLMRTRFNGDDLHDRSAAGVEFGC